MIPWLPLLVACHRVDAPVVSINPLVPDTTDNLVAMVEDAGSDLTYSYAWFKDEVDQGVDTDTVLADLTARGETWRVEVVADDGKGTSDPGQATVTIQNAAPEVSVSLAPLVPGTLDDLVASAEAVDPDGDAVTVTWSWTVDGADAGLDGDTVPSDRTERGETWEATAQATDGNDAASGAASVVIEDILPLVTSVTLSPGDAWEDTVLTASAEAQDGDGDPVTFTWTWYVNEASVKEGEDPTLDGTFFDKHDEVRAEATPSDGFEEGTALSSQVVVIQNTIPQVSGVLFVPDPFDRDDDLVCTGDGWTDPDPDTEGYEVFWTVNGSVVGTGTTLDLSPYERGEMVTCTLTPFDGEAVGDTVSDSGVLGNAPPRISSVRLSNMSPTSTDTLSVELSSSDSDGDPITFTYQWYLNGALDVTTPTKSCGGLSAGDKIWVVVTPYDGIDMGPSAGSDTAIVSG